MICNKYKIISYLNKGTFGKVYKGLFVRKNEYVAIKMEIPNICSTIKHEAKILDYLFRENVKSIPIIYWYGIYENQYTLIMTYYDCSLTEYIKNTILSHSHINHILQKLLDILETIHSHKVIHRDIKPDNFMIKNGDIYIIDFGFSGFYLTDNGNHIEESSEKRKTIIGSPKYTSIWIHEGSVPTRRDDIISIGYIGLYMIFNKLPWENINNHDLNSDYDKMDVLYPPNQWRLKMKQIQSISEHFSEITEKTVLKFIEKTYSLSFSEKPYYNLI
jgi:serine/threonine protein kinase